MMRARRRLERELVRFATTLVAMCLFAYSTDAGARRIPSAPATGTFTHIVFSHTTGRVGYHMFANLGIYDWDVPTGNWSTCDPAQSDMTATGTIPAGLTLLTHGEHGFDGTPRQPGDWTVEVTIGHIKCTQGADQTDYGPRTVEVHFHIDP